MRGISKAPSITCEAARSLARNLRVEISCNCPIERMIKRDASQNLANSEADRGVRLRDGTEIPGDLVVSSIDAEHRPKHSILLLGVEGDLRLTSHDPVYG